METISMCPKCGSTKFVSLGTDVGGLAMKQCLECNKKGLFMEVDVSRVKEIQAKYRVGTSSKVIEDSS